MFIYNFHQSIWQRGCYGMHFKSKKTIRRTLLVVSVLLAVGCAVFLLYYLGIQPYYSRKINEKYKTIYYSSSDNSDGTVSSVSKTPDKPSYRLDTSHKNNAKAPDGTLLKFSKLIEYNSDIKGWLKISGTNIDYPVMRAYDGGDFYLKHNFEGSSDKNGCLYIDGNCRVKSPSKNIVIHGHNMESTGMMFSQLSKYKKLEFYKKHPVFTFDTIYQNSQWKIISYMRVPGNLNKQGSFNYMVGDFESEQDFLDFLYQIEVRSLYHCPVDVNENDTLLMLSTCSYEANNYRTVVVARKVRKKESLDVNTDAAYIRDNVFYPDAWYTIYGGKAPVVTSFADAMSFGEIDWYDGSFTVSASIGKTVSHRGLNYKITSSSTLEYLGCDKTNFKTLSIPSSVKIDERKYDITALSSHSFDKMRSLRSLKIGNKVETLPSKAFVNCTKLESVIIGDSVKEIGSKAFYQLENLKKIKIRSSELKAIKEKAFGQISPHAKFKLPNKYAKKYSQMLKNSGISENARIVKY